MCNLHSITTNQEATRHLARVMVDNTGNMQPLRTAFLADCGACVLLAWPLMGSGATQATRVVDSRLSEYMQGHPELQSVPMLALLAALAVFAVFYRRKTK